ncbi:hypothetical protein PoB_003075600 [Plakobranchus ocellatus]|uniref:Uncharacterized protein n=1 Tax=Plakobranchus ocellatus TaxID=259542 RepID=A0AAV4A7M4_9GAST|nr:hypothetical protein PoB_003075600 [Plakobranchus ocellatus]
MKNAALILLAGSNSRHTRFSQNLGDVKLKPVELLFHINDRYLGSEVLRGGGASDTKRFVERLRRHGVLKGVKQTQRCEADSKKRSLLWSHLGVEVRQELNCLLDSDTHDPHRMLAFLSSSYGEWRSISALMGILHQTRPLHGEPCTAFPPRQRKAYHTLTALIGVSRLPTVAFCGITLRRAWSIR